LKSPQTIESEILPPPAKEIETVVEKTKESPKHIIFDGPQPTGALLGIFRYRDFMELILLITVTEILSQPKLLLR